MIPANLVYVVDDDDDVRQALCALLASAGMEVRAYPTAMDFLANASPDLTGCIVLDVRMPGMSGLALQEELNQRGIGLPVIFITGHGDIPMAVRAMRAGAADFLLKPFDNQELLECVRQCMRTNTQAQQARQSREAAVRRFAALTSREWEVLEYIMAGRHSKSIAHELGISVNTLDVHRFNIMRKTGARTLTELIRLRMQAGDAVVP